MPLQIPYNLLNTLEGHAKWLKIFTKAQTLLEDDVALQDSAAKGLRLKERSLPPAVLGKFYAQYCVLTNQLYDAYLNNVHLQRAPYIMAIINVFVKRLYELRNELVHVIVNDYIYVDSALNQLLLTPMDIQIVVPYHFPLEGREDTIEKLLQKLWADAVRRKKIREKPPPPARKIRMITENESHQAIDDREPSDNVLKDMESENSTHTIKSEEYTHVVNIQKHERFRMFFVIDFRKRCLHRRTYFGKTCKEASIQMKNSAAALIQKIFRQYMMIKRQHYLESKRDVILGLIPDPFKQRRLYDEENNKIYKHRREVRLKIQSKYLEDMEKENLRIMLLKKDNQIDDITEHIHAWFKEWYYGYGFFPEYPYEVEGGTLLVIRGDFNSVEEQIAEDEKLAAASKGKSPEMLKDEKKQAKINAKIKAEQEKEQKKREAVQMLKLRCNPFEDPGYQPKQSECLSELIETLQNYRTCWSMYDTLPPEQCADSIYGYLKPLLTEELMCQLHKECRIVVDNLMRTDLKLLITMHQKMYERIGMKFPKQKARKKPKIPAIPKPFIINSELEKEFEEIFDMCIITKPTTKLRDVFGDFNYAASEMNEQDPNPKFPLPGYGDVKRRLVLSCIFGIGMESGAKRNKAVMLLGPPRNGKSFLIDAVAGELNAVKIDISPKEFSAKLDNPAKVLNQVLLAARAFQPTVIYMRNIEKVFSKTVAPEDQYLNAQSLKGALSKLLKTMPLEEKIIFIATCSDPLSAQTQPMTSLFNEIILVPRTDYGTLQQFFYNKLQSIKSMPRDYCVQPVAQLLQGYGFGVIVEAFNNIMTAERITRLNIKELSPIEFLEQLIENECESVTLEDYQVYVDFFIANSPLSTERKEYEIINNYRAVVYEKMAKVNNKKNA